MSKQQRRKKAKVKEGARADSIQGNEYGACITPALLILSVLPPQQPPHLSLLFFYERICGPVIFPLYLLSLFLKKTVEEFPAFSVNLPISQPPKRLPIPVFCASSPLAFLILSLPWFLTISVMPHFSSFSPPQKSKPRHYKNDNPPSFPPFLPPCLHSLYK